MIPKSLILSFLALQGPGMGPSSRGAKDVAIFGDVTAAPQEVMKLGGSGTVITSWSLHSQTGKQADFSDYPPGEWDDDTLINGDLKVNAHPNRSWVYSLSDTFPNLAKPPGNQDHVFGGMKVNARLRLEFTVPRVNTVVYLLYQADGKSAEASITTQLTNKAGTTPQKDNLRKGWNLITYTGGYNSFDISVDSPDLKSNILLAQVDYPEK
jgi:hypothetical protein